MKQPLTMNVLTHIAGAAILAKIRITEVNDVIMHIWFQCMHSHTCKRRH